MASIYSLGPDILLGILRYLDDESPLTIKRSVVLVNKQLYATAQLVTHRRKTIIYHLQTQLMTQNKIREWLKDPFVLRNIRQLTLKGTSCEIVDRPPQQTSEQADLKSMWIPIIELMTKVTRLVKVEFDFPGAEFPLAMLEALQTYHPQVQLYVWSYYRDAELDHTDAAEQALSVSPILRGIRTNTLVRGGRFSIDLRIAAFQRIVANAPNLRFASITTGPANRATNHQTPEDYIREQEAAAKFFQNLRGPNTSVRKLTLDGFALNKTTLAEWGKYVSLPHLTDLKCSRGLPESSYFQVAPSLLTNLKHVSLNLTSANQHGFMSTATLTSLVNGYLATCAPLETLSLWGWMFIVSFDNIMKHGPTLKRLELHERETLDADFRRYLLSVEEVRHIRNECPRLEYLTLDMDREDVDWHRDLDQHKEMLDEISQFGTRLQRMNIYLDLGIANLVDGAHGPRTSRQDRNTDSLGNSTNVSPDEDIGDTAPNSTTAYDYKGPFHPLSHVEMKQHAQQLWKMIFGDPARTGPRELDVKWGEWERKIDRIRPTRWATWEQAHKAYLRVRPHERDDRPGEAVVRVQRFASINQNPVDADEGD